MAAGTSLRRMLAIACVAPTMLIAACADSTPKSAATPKAGVPSDLSVGSFSADFSYMAKLKAMTAAGGGMVGVILADTNPSSRYRDFAAPLQRAFEQAGYNSSQFKMDNAQGSDASELSLAQDDVAQGATVLVIDPLNDMVGTQIAQYAQEHGVKVITYHRAIF